MSAALCPRWLAAKVGLVALYAVYAARAVGMASPLVTLNAVGAAAFMFALLRKRAAIGPARVRSVLAALTLVLAAGHARAIPLTSAFHGLQLGLAAAVAASSLVTLALHRGAQQARVALAVAVGAAVLVALPAAPGLGAATAALTGAVFAWLRPLGAIGAALQTAGMHRGPRDPGLFWSAVPPAASHPQEAHPCR